MCLGGEGGLYVWASVCISFKHFRSRWFNVINLMECHCIVNFRWQNSLSFSSTFILIVIVEQKCEVCQRDLKVMTSSVVVPNKNWTKVKMMTG